MEHIIVRRGRFLTYEQLRRNYAGDPSVEIIWDRRRPMDMLALGSGAPVDRRGRARLEWERDYFFTSGKRPNDPSEPPTS